jgi:uncharacterized protein (DUF1810 family)
MPATFDDFVAAQDPVWRTAMNELRAGQKRSHWIWFVFPQLAGLGSSAMAVRYALATPDDARAYLAHDVLRARLLDAVSIVHEQLTQRGASLARLMGSHIDALKLVSSMTLFAAVAAAGNAGAPRADLDALALRAAAILDVAARQGLRRCAHTESALRA